MNEFDMKTSDFRAIYRIFELKLSHFFGQNPFKNELWPMDLM